MTDTSGYPAASPPPSPPPMAPPPSPPPYAGATMAGDQPVVDPLAWPVPPSTGLPALSTTPNGGEQARADALYATLLPRAQAAYVEYVMVRTPHLWQDYIATKLSTSAAP